jgi:hypothetical protein
MRVSFRRLPVLLVVTLAVISIGACGLFGPPPGEGAAAERGYAAAAPVIAALEVYHAERQAYPKTLEELVPGYLPAIPQPAEMPPLRYESTGPSYELMFEYVGPGMNRCRYSPESEWQCMGYY